MSASYGFLKDDVETPLRSITAFAMLIGIQSQIAKNYEMTRLHNALRRKMVL